MSERLTGIVLAHEQLAQALVEAVRAIAGEEHGLVPVSNTGCDRAAILARLEQAIAERPCIVFADMPGGSCAFSAAVYARANPLVRVVTGVNLAMLLDFAFHRELSLDAAAERLVHTGKGSVTALAALGPAGAAGGGRAR